MIKTLALFSLSLSLTNRRLDSFATKLTFVNPDERPWENETSYLESLKLSVESQIEKRLNDYCDPRYADYLNKRANQFILPLIDFHLLVFRRDIVFIPGEDEESLVQKVMMNNVFNDFFYPRLIKIYMLDTINEPILRKECVKFVKSIYDLPLYKDGYENSTNFLRLMLFTGQELEQLGTNLYKILKTRSDVLERILNNVDLKLSDDTISRYLADYTKINSFNNKKFILNLIKQCSYAFSFFSLYKEMFTDGSFYISAFRERELQNIKKELIGTKEVYYKNKTRIHRTRYYLFSVDIAFVESLIGFNMFENISRNVGDNPHACEGFRSLIEAEFWELIRTRNNDTFKLSRDELIMLLSRFDKDNLSCLPESLRNKMESSYRFYEKYNALTMEVFFQNEKDDDELGIEKNQESLEVATLVKEELENAVKQKKKTKRAKKNSKKKLYCQNSDTTITGITTNDAVDQINEPTNEDSDSESSGRLDGLTDDEEKEHAEETTSASSDSLNKLEDHSLKLLFSEKSVLSWTPSRSKSYLDDPINLKPRAVHDLLESFYLFLSAEREEYFLSKRQSFTDDDDKRYYAAVATLELMIGGIRQKYTGLLEICSNPVYGLDPSQTKFVFHLRINSLVYVDVNENESGDVVEEKTILDDTTEDFSKYLDGRRIRIVNDKRKASCFFYDDGSSEPTRVLNVYKLRYLNRERVDRSVESATKLYELSRMLNKTQKMLSSGFHRFSMSN